MIGRNNMGRPIRSSSIDLYKNASFYHYLLYRNKKTNEKTCSQPSVGKGGKKDFNQINHPSNVISSNVKELGVRNSVTETGSTNLRKTSLVKNSLLIGKVRVQGEAKLPPTPQEVFLGPTGIFYGLTDTFLSPYSHSLFKKSFQKSFFPYRKSFWCYWLLPFVGFIYGINNINNSGLVSSLTLPSSVQSYPQPSHQPSSQSSCSSPFFEETFSSPKNSVFSFFPNQRLGTGTERAEAPSIQKLNFWNRERNNFRIENLPVLTFSIPVPNQRLGKKDQSFWTSSFNTASDNVTGLNDYVKGFIDGSSGETEKVELSHLIKKSCTLYLHSLEEYLKNPTPSLIFNPTTDSSHSFSSWPFPTEACQKTEFFGGSRPFFVEKREKAKLPSFPSKSEAVQKNGVFLEGGGWEQEGKTIQKSFKWFWYDLPIPNIDNRASKINLWIGKVKIIHPSLLSQPYDKIGMEGKANLHYSYGGLKMGLFLNEAPFMSSSVSLQELSSYPNYNFNRDKLVGEPNDIEYRKYLMEKVDSSFQKLSFFWNESKAPSITKKRSFLEGRVCSAETSVNNPVLSYKRAALLLDNYYKKELLKTNPIFTVQKRSSVFKTITDESVPKEGQIYTKLTKKELYKLLFNKLNDSLNKMVLSLTRNTPSFQSTENIALSVFSSPDEGFFEKRIETPSSQPSTQPFDGNLEGKENSNLEKNNNQMVLNKGNVSLFNINKNRNRISLAITHKFLSKFTNFQSTKYPKLSNTVGIPREGGISFPYNLYKENETASIQVNPIKKRKGVLKFVYPLLISCKENETVTFQQSPSCSLPPKNSVFWQASLSKKTPFFWKEEVGKEGSPKAPLLEGANPQQTGHVNSILVKKEEKGEKGVKTLKVDSSFKYKKEHFLKNRVSISNMETYRSFSNMSLDSNSNIKWIKTNNDFLYYSKFLNNYTSKLKEWVFSKGEGLGEADTRHSNSSLPSLFKSSAFSLFSTKKAREKDSSKKREERAPKITLKLDSFNSNTNNEFQAMTPVYKNGFQSINLNINEIHKNKKKVHISRIEKLLRSFLSIKTSKTSKTQKVPSSPTYGWGQGITRDNNRGSFYPFFFEKSKGQFFKGSLRNKKGVLKTKREALKINTYNKLLSSLRTTNRFILSTPFQPSFPLLLKNRNGRKLTIDKQKNSFFKLSPRLLVKNRMFIKDPISLKQIPIPKNIEVETSNLVPVTTESGLQLRIESFDSETLFASVRGSSYPNSSKSEDKSENIGQTRKNLQKKRRKKKMKKETRRRKKRKRFYPRPLWIRYRLFNSLAKKRYYTFLSLLKTLKVESMSSSNSYIISPLMNNKISTLFLNENENQNFYKVSRNVLGDLNRLLWKSYWLSSNLNPYLKTVRSSLNQMKKSAQVWDFYKTLKSLLSYLGGFSFLIPPSPFQKQSLPFLGVFWRTGQDNSNFDYLNRNSFSNQNPLLQSKVNTGSQKLSVFSCPQPSVGEGGAEKRNSTWQTALYLAEYNRISYQRIQNYISQIRENLTPLGEIKVRSPHLGHFSTGRLARKREADLQKSADFWIKFGKTIISYTEGNYQKSLFNKNFHLLEGKGAGYFFTNVKSPNLRMYWALSKTNLASFKDKDLNKRNQTWAIEKMREQTKHNKTKKMYKTISEKLQDLLRNEEGSLYYKFLKKGLNDKDITFSDVGSRVVFNFNSLNKHKNNENENGNNLNEKTEKTEKREVWPSLLKKSLKKIRVQELKVQFYGFKPLGNNKKYLRDIKNQLNNTSLPPKNEVFWQDPRFPFFLRKKGETSKIFKGPKLNKIEMNKNQGMSETWSNKLTNKSAYWWDLQQIPPAIPTFGWDRSEGPFLTSFDFVPTFFPKVSLPVPNLWLGKKDFPIGGWVREAKERNREAFGPQPSQTQNFNNQILWISTLLFHFCTILSLLSISQIRGVLKFAFLGFSKIYKSSNKILSFISDSILRFKSLVISYNLSTSAQDLDSLSVRRKLLEYNSQTTVNTTLSYSQPPIQKLRFWKGKGGTNRKNQSYSGQSLFKSRIYLPTFNLFINNPSSLSPYKNTNHQHHKKLSTSLLFKTGNWLVEGAVDSVIPSNMNTNINSITNINRSSESFISLSLSGVKGAGLEIPKTFNHPFIFYKDKKDKKDKKGTIKRKSFYLALPKKTKFVQKQQSLFWLVRDQGLEVLKTHGGSLVKEQGDADLYNYNYKFKGREPISKPLSKSSKTSGTLNTSLFTNIISFLIKSKLYSLYSGTFSLFKQTLEIFARLSPTEGASFLFSSKKGITKDSSFTSKQNELFNPAISSSGTSNKNEQSDRGSVSNFIFQFFEKPGELIIDWIAYMFLVEWASDMPNTIPENFDMYLGNSCFKVLRTVHNMNLWTLTELMNYSLVFTTKSLLTKNASWPQMEVGEALPIKNLLTGETGFSFFYPSSNFQYGTLTSLLRNDVKEMTENYYNTEASQKLETSLLKLNMNKEISLLSLGSTFIKRRLYYLYEILLFQLYQPDTDLIVRQKRGILFWDIWGDFLTQTAEDSNINISELTSLKEEQFKLLEKCAEISESIQARSNKPNIIKQGDVNQGQGLRKLLFSLNSSNQKPEVFDKPFAKRGGRVPAFYSTALSEPKVRMGLYPKTKLSNTYDIRKGKQVGYDFLDKTGSFPFFVEKRIEGSATSSSQPYDKVGKGGDREWVRKEKEKNKKNFAAQQFLSYQGKDTELFIELHPPKSFNMIRLIHQNEAVQQPIGSLVCQIFSGLLSKQISKNILVVGGSSNSAGGQGIEKTLLVQAIAGETELKIITDNAYRYAMVHRGVAVGIKLLRDVFDSLALHTPCLFLIEDIHAIGERRPLLISDEDSVKGSNSSIFGSQREEIHEKNQVLYQLSKHQITHYRKPYKGDFSLSIPTNHFCFSLFFNNPNGGFEGNNTDDSISPKDGAKHFGKIIGTVSNSKRLLSPKINVSTSESGGAAEENKKEDRTSENQKIGFSSSGGQDQQKKSISSRLLLKNSELLAPPATSPFSVLTLKEEKKFKPYKVVSEIPWAGLPSEQLAQISKASYSIRVKVALLAEMAISSLTVKLDMITDLLVIMDSVKGNRGFVVFATTHVPYILDPALRRPGRLDETITLGSFPTLLCRWEILKSSFGLFNYFNTKGRQSFIAQHLGYSYKVGISLDLTLSPLAFGTASNLFNFGKLNSNVNVIHRDLKKWISNHYQNQNQKNHLNYQSLPPAKENSLESSFSNKEKQLSNIYSTSPNLMLTMSGIVHSKTTTFKEKEYEKDKSFMNMQHISTNTNIKGSLSTNPRFSPFFEEKRKKDTKKILSKTYFIASVNLRCASNANVNLHNANSLRHLTTETKQKFNGNKHNHLFKIEKKKTQTHSFIDNPRFYPFFVEKWKDPLNFNIYGNVNGLYSFSSNYLSFYASPYQLKNQVILLISGKIGEILFFAKKQGSLSKSSYWNNSHPFNNNNSVQNQIGNYLSNPLKRFFYSGVYTTYGLSNTWQVLSSLIVSFIQKRFIYHQNLIVPKLFDISNYNSIHEPPSPPSSNILLPARRYENYKRSFSFYSGIQNVRGQGSEVSTTHGGSPAPQSTGILDKLQLHQQQRLIKRLYRVPVQESYRSEIIANRMTGFSNASLMIGSLTRNVLQKPSRSNWFIKNNILKRHRNYLTNQWWNGQLPEHNAETTFLSDIDWRYTFVDSVGDLLLDFPDADSYYNPRNRRWFLTKGLNHNWFNFDKNIYSEIYSHLIFDAFVKAFHLYEKNREVLDYYAFYSLKNGLYNSFYEFNMLKLYQRFLPDPFCSRSKSEAVQKNSVFLEG